MGDSVPDKKKCLKKSHVDHDDDDKDLIMIAIGLMLVVYTLILSLKQAFRKHAPTCTVHSSRRLELGAGNSKPTRSATEALAQLLWSEIVENEDFVIFKKKKTCPSALTSQCACSFALRARQPGVTRLPMKSSRIIGCLSFGLTRHLEVARSLASTEKGGLKTMSKRSEGFRQGEGDGGERGAASKSI